jgi:Toprim domain
MSDTPWAIAGYCGRGERTGSNSWKGNCPICSRHALSVSYGNKFSIIIRCWHCEACGLNDGWTEQRAFFVSHGLLEPTDFDARNFNNKEYDEYCQKRRAEVAQTWRSPFFRPLTPDDFVAKYLYSRGLEFFIGHSALRVGPFFSVLIARVWHVEHGLSALQYTWTQWEGPAVGDAYPTGKVARRQTFGVLKGGAVWLGNPHPDEEFVVGEGLETTLSAMLLMNARCGAAVLGPNLKGLVLPKHVRKVRIAADNDETGRGAAGCASRLWQQQGLKVRVSIPHTEGDDFNDVLMAGGVNYLEGFQL